MTALLEAPEIDLAPPVDGDGARALLRELARLDRRLAAAVAAMRDAHGPEAAADPYRGLYVSHEEAGRLAERAPGAPADFAVGLDGDAPEDEDRAAGDDGSRWGRLRRAAGLSRLDAEILLMALAPEVETKYERVYAYLQDDVTRRRPTVELALGLLCATWEARTAARARLSASAPLRRHRLVALIDDPAHRAPPLLSRYLKPAERVVDFLLGSDEPDAALLGLARPIDPAARLADLLLADALKAALAAVVRDAAPGRTALVYLHGPYGAGKRTAAEALCREAGIPLLAVDVARVIASDDPGGRIGAAAREALLRGAAVLWEGFDLLLADDRRMLRDAVLRESEGRGATFLSGERPWDPADAPPGQAFYRVALERPGHGERARLWRAALNGAAAGVDPDALAAGFRFTGGQIRDAAATARSLARVRDPRGGRVTMDDLCAASRIQSSSSLSALAKKVTTRQRWDDLVLPADRVRQLREIVNALKYRARVYGEWGFDRALAMGKGVNALFSGPPGTGKTMAAGIIGAELGLDLWRIDLSAMVSKYIGETEKNLARIFEEAETGNAILFFDEADALFGKRSEVRDSHDRYANLEVSYLLQRMEEYEGVVILATNFRKNMDEAFVRRLHFAVDFPFPAEGERLRIWERVFPAATPRCPAMSLERAARRLEVAGGAIRNIALAAAFLAADDGGVVTMEHLARAAKREFQKMGKVVSDREFEVLVEEG